MSRKMKSILTNPLFRGRKARGFTLLEIMVVIAIIGAIIAIAVPKFGSVFETNIKGAMRRFAGTVMFCFHESVIKQSVLRLNMDPVLGEYWPTILISSGTVGEFTDLGGSVVKKAQLPAGIRFVDIVTPHDTFKKMDEPAFITFFPTGYAERALIHLADTTGHGYSLIVQPLTGEVEILDGYVDLVDVQVKGPFEQQSEGNL
jgi:general secretion pathway protein H